MLDRNQLSSIGFSWVTENTEVLTPYGAELIRRPHYYSAEETELLEREQKNVRALCSALLERPEEMNVLMRLLMPIKDIRRSIGALAERTLSEVELFEVKRFLMELELIAPQLAKTGAELAGLEITALPRALGILDPDSAGSPSFYVSDRLSPKLAGIRAARRRVDDEIKRTGGSEELRIERTRLAAEEEEENALVRAQMCEKLRAWRESMQLNAEHIGRLDLAVAKARLMLKTGAAMPKVGGEGFALRGMYNPRFAESLSEKGRSFVPVSLKLMKGSVVITGANMGGKSVAIKTLALNVQLAMCGFPVFAEEAELPFVEDIYLLSEDREDTESGLSSFGGEMKAFDDMLKNTAKSRNVLVLLDEFARGTNPNEGAALVAAAAKLFNKRENVYAVIATHFDGVAKLARLHYQVAGLRNADQERLRLEMKNGSPDTLAKYMDYGLYPVSPSEEPPRDAVTIIKALGVSGEFTELIDIIND
ncbi:MAG: hypothetical protein K6G56_09435 [Clostridiales bacterium]|nr:hypothetical protein [Clostridiales bacterium]